MKFRTILPLAIMAASTLSVVAQTPWIHVYVKNHKTNTSEIGFPSMPVSEIDSVYFTEYKGRFSKMGLRGSGQSYELPFSNISYWTIGPNVPTFRFTTSPALQEVESKEEYLDGMLAIDGAGLVSDFSGPMLIRGRGNSTWNYPKKAYRVKFAEKTKLCGFRKAKNYVLLANFIDPTLMRNHAAFTAAQLCGMPYPNHAMAVDVYFNDECKGSYMLTEKCGFNNGSVDLPADVEANSIMFELDTNFDEDYRQVSPYFMLPVNLKDPNAPADPEAAKTWWDEWFADFEAMEQAVFYGQNIGLYIDYTSLARYLLTFNICCNQELNHPKSVYLYKTKGEKYQFGPAWDFDWAFGYSPTYRVVSSEGLTAEERQALIDGAVEAAKAQDVQWFPFTYNGFQLIWCGDEIFCWFDGQQFVYGWPDSCKSYGPSYNNFLLGYGQNSNNPGGMGNGGEFFLSIVMNNPEFMAEYKRVWDEFSAKLPEFWASFDAYAATLPPTFERNVMLWGMKSSNPGDTEFAGAEDNLEGAIGVLRAWLQKRIDFISNPDNNYGLYDPATAFQPGMGN